MFLDRTIAKYPWLSGAIIFVAAAQWIVSVEIAEALYPNYSISQNFLSDLGATCPSTLRGPGLSVLVWANVEPRFDTLRLDPRFTSLLARIGFEPSKPGPETKENIPS